jgi:CRISPR/Cas system CMR subunit Cmr4 (Cas7 group RAMP superfamily)
MKPDRIRIVYTLTFATPFHCGTGMREGLVDRTVVRDGQGYLYIPGSTFKGLLRERCEQLARFYGLPNIASPHDTQAALLRMGNVPPSLITHIFGAQHRPGRLFFDDARQEDLEQYNSTEKGAKPGNGKYKSLQVSIATQVRLDRSTRTAVPGALYTSEFGSDGLAFQGIIQGWLDGDPITSSALEGTKPTYSLLLLLAGLRMVERIGGNKSTGKGRFTCTITELAVNGASIEQQVWESWLDALADLGKEG